MSEEDRFKNYRFPLNSLDKEECLTGIEAAKAEQLLNGVKIGTWTDTVLKKLPKSEMSEPPEVLGLNKTIPEELHDDPKWWPSYVVRWTYPDFKLIIAVGVSSYPKTYVYAVQKIRITKDLDEVELEKEWYDKD